MTVRRKTLIALGSSVLVLTLATIALSRWALNREAQRAETELAKREAKRASTALAYELARLDTTAQDYASWDDTYAFVQKFDQAYVDSNFVATTFTNNRFSLALIINRNGETVFAKHVDPATGENSPVPESLAKHECLHGLLRKVADTEEGVSGLLELPEGLYLVATKPVLTSEYVGPAQGALLFATLLDEAETGVMSKVTGLSLAILPLDPENAVGAEILRLSTGNEAMEGHVHVLSDQKIAADILLRDICGDPVSALRVTMPRSLRAEVMLLLRFVLWSIVSISVVLGLVVTVFLDRVFLERLSRLRAFIDDLRSSNRLDSRVEVSGTDELSAFASHLNGMLDKLEEDVARREREERERKNLEEQFRHAQKMEAIGQLAGGVAHDFNNLLQVILGHLDLMQRAPGLGHITHADIAAIREAAEKAADLTRQLLAFSRRQIIQPERLDLNEVILDVLKMVRRVIGEHIEPCFIPGQHLGTIQADRGQLAQILMNLCVNARDAMPGGGRLTIETQAVQLDNDHAERFSGAVPGPYVRLSVADTGQGMDDETKAHIFEPFFTTKELGRGTGLGLATVYGIVKQHGGFIEVESRKEMGATFHIYLPVVEGPPEKREHKPVQQAAGGTETILVAEDEEPVLNLTTRILRGAGYTVLTANDGEEALRIFERNAATVDLALLDVIMPSMNGREVMERIQAIDGHTRFLFCSGYSEDTIDKDFVIEKGVRLVPKPYARTELLRAVRETLDAPKT